MHTLAVVIGSIHHCPHPCGRSTIYGVEVTKGLNQQRLGLRATDSGPYGARRVHAHGGWECSRSPLPLSAWKAHMESGGRRCVAASERARSFPRAGTCHGGVCGRCASCVVCTRTRRIHAGATEPCVARLAGAFRGRHQQFADGRWQVSLGTTWGPRTYHAEKIRFAAHPAAHALGRAGESFWGRGRIRLALPGQAEGAATAWTRPVVRICKSGGRASNH